MEMAYDFREIERKWQAAWAGEGTFKVREHKGDKFYVLDMFPYPSGSGLHVGHPLGYIATDIVARYKRHRGFNVLHPMGYDSFGLPAEQYAIQTGRHPRETTDKNIARYRQQLDRLGFSFDWSREVRTSDPSFYKWTQWIFIKLFHSWFNNETNRAEPIDTLVARLEQQGAVTTATDARKPFGELDEQGKSDLLMQYRLAYLDEAWVNWCPALGTVLANEEVKDGVSERGGHPVARKRMPQWSLRITAYADRLLDGLDDIDWSDSIREAQRNWIGRSDGSTLFFEVADGPAAGEKIEVFTTRPDTVFGATFLSVAPEHGLAGSLATPEQQQAVNAYARAAANRSERDRQADVKNVTGKFTGSHVLHPFTKEKIPVWVAEYVLAGYGTGAVMGVPAHDTRDYAFARHFGLEVIKVIEPADESLKDEPCFDTYEGRCINSRFLDGLEVSDAIGKAITEIEKQGTGKRKVNYRLRDAAFGRQRYWGEPIPVYFRNGIPCTMPEDDLPLRLPDIDTFLPTETGDPPLARAGDWTYRPEGDSEQWPLETTTMPGWAGSSWYYLRYMDPHNEEAFASKEALGYWRDVDLYIGGSEHATGHLLYVRFWTKFLHDLGYLEITEPARKLINQGMIQGRSNIIYRVEFPDASTDIDFPLFIGEESKKELQSSATGAGDLAKMIDSEFGVKMQPIEGKSLKIPITPIHVDVNLVNEDMLELNDFRSWKPEFRDARFLGGDKIKCGWEIEKMSKRWHNVVNPDDICDKYGADCLRMYEMFLGPLEQGKPWNTNGITGVYGFLKKTWKLFEGNVSRRDHPAEDAMKSLHKLIKKVTTDIEQHSFNTCVSAFMICVNELAAQKCDDLNVLEPLCILLSPFAPHMAEELWRGMGHEGGISAVAWPGWDEKYLAEASFTYPVSINGKTRFKIPLSLELTKDQVAEAVLAAEELKRYTTGNTPRKVIVVPGRIVNVVV